MSRGTVGRSYDAVVIGAGHNALVCGAYLARAGLHTAILERRDEVGGALGTATLARDVRVPALAHTVGRLLPSVATELALYRHGLELIQPQARAFAPQPDGRSVTLWGDVGRTSEELRAWSPRDADAYPAFDRRVRALASFLARLQAATPPDLVSPSARDALGALGLGRAFRALEEPDARELLRVLPTAVADFVADSFESDPLRAALATRGVQYAALGPWSAGTTAVLLGDSAGGGGAAGQTVMARGGPGTLARALADSARSFGADIHTGSEVARVLSEDGRATGVALVSGEELSAPVVASGADPKRTLVGLVDPVVLGPTLAWRAENIRMPGVVAKINLALSGLPRFVAAGEDGAIRLQGRILLAPGIDALERAFDATKYGRVAESPYLEVTIPTLADPTLAPEGTHVMSVIAQYAPYHRRDGEWDADRDAFGDLVLKTLDAYAPGIGDLVTERTVVTPLDLERDYALTEGHALHGDPGLDQFFAWRPLLGYARYRMPLEGLYLCGAGAHPGGGVTGAPGANAAREILLDWGRRRPRS